MENSPKLKILYLITKSNFGGAQRYVFDLATEATKAGHEVVVVFGGNGMLKTYLEQQSIRTIPIDTLGRDVKILSDLQSFFFLITLFHREKPDIVHLNSSKMGGLGALAARLVNGWWHLTRPFASKQKTMRIVFTGHGWAWNEERSDLERFVIGIFHWLTIELAHVTIAVSKRTRDQVGILPFVWHKLHVIHNGRDPIATLPKEEACNMIFREHKEQFLTPPPLAIIGTIAELHKSKGLIYAVEGMALLKKQRPNDRLIFVMIGEEGSERTAIEASVKKYELGDSVFIAGRKENAATLLSAFDIFLLPSITEAFPYVILEAGNAGLPVIATAVGGIPEIIDDMESGILIQSRNGSEGARAITYLIDNKERCAELGRTLKERIRDRFSIAHMAKETFALYQKPS